MTDNASRDIESQVSPGEDPALQPEHQHHHSHHHHTAFAEKGREDEVVYSNETAGFEKGIVPEPTPLDHASKSQSQSTGDEETGNTQPAPRAWYRRLTKHWRHGAHLVIWLLFTG